MTLPWHFYPAEDNSLKIDPVEELKALRYDDQKVDDITLAAGEEQVIDELGSDCMEVKMTISPESAECGFKLLCSPDGEEQTVVTYNTAEQAFVIDFENASNDKTLGYSKREDAETVELRQVVPYSLPKDKDLKLDIFVDKSVIEIFVNSDICIVQRVYPMRADSKQFRLFAKGDSVMVKDIVKWEMDTTNSW